MRYGKDLKICFEIVYIMGSSDGYKFKHFVMVCMDLLGQALTHQLEGLSRGKIFMKLISC